MTSLDRMKFRLSYTGYENHDNTIVKAKYDSFQSALKRSYQAEWITLNKDQANEKKWRCLINPSRLTEEFDKKVISIDYDSGVKEGTIFFWDRTNEYWIINLQQHSEEAYFRGLITRCNYEIDVDGTKYWATVRGPEETSTQWRQAHRTTWNDLNYSLVLEVTKDSKTVKYFTRHKVIKVKMYYPDAETGEILEQEDNWKVVATDKYSSDNLIEVYVDEWYNNEAEDIKNAEDEAAEARSKEEYELDTMQPHIEGPRTVNIFDTDISYAIVGYDKGEWSVSSKKVNIKSFDDKSCVLDIMLSKAGRFILTFTAIDGTKVNEEIYVNSF